MNATASDKNKLQDYFQIKCKSCIPTGGLDYGVILKFATFYLKIYDSKDRNSYVVQGFLYKNPEMIFEDSIPLNGFKHYASMFRDNYLIDRR